MPRFLFLDSEGGCNTPDFDQGVLVCLFRPELWLSGNFGTIFVMAVRRAKPVLRSACRGAPEFAGSVTLAG